MLDELLDRSITPLSTLGLLLAKALKQYPDEQLLQWLTDDDAIVREAVAKALHMRSSPKTLESIVNLTKSARYEFREVACIALGQFGTPEYPFIDRTMDILTSMLSDDYFEVQAAALYAFGHLTGRKQPQEASINTILSMAKHDRQEVRAALASSLTSITDPRVKETLELLEKDDSEQVRDSAEWCLQTREELSQ